MDDFKFPSMNAQGKLYFAREKKGSAPPESAEPEEQVSV